jgi:hypothetical protein
VVAPGTGPEGLPTSCPAGNVLCSRTPSTMSISGDGPVKRRIQIQHSNILADQYSRL